MSIEKQKVKAGALTTATALASLLLIGCQSDSQNKATDDPTSEAGVAREQRQIQVQGANASQSDGMITLDYPVLLDRNDALPDWVINPGLGGILGAVGAGPVCRLGTKEQLNEARLSARLELAQMFELRLQGVDREQLEQQLQANGNTLSDNSRKSLLAVDRSITDIVLAGSRQRALWFDPETDECYVWMVLDGKVLDMADHYIAEDVSVFIANTPISSEYKPTRRKQPTPTVIVEAPEQGPAPAPEVKEPIEVLEEKLKDLETIPVEKDGKE